MIGAVRSHHVLLKLTVISKNTRILEILADVDTGFVGFLTLPQVEIDHLGLEYEHSFYAYLADNSRIKVDIYMATVNWLGQLREIEVIATGIRPLIGTLLLDGCEMNIKFVEGGIVTINELTV